MPDQKATGRPTQPIPFLPKALLLASLCLAGLEIVFQIALQQISLGPLSGRLPFLAPTVRHYAHARFWVINHPAFATLGLVALVALAAFVERSVLLWWHNTVVSRLTGTHFDQSTENFPNTTVDLLAEIARRPIDPTAGLIAGRPARQKFVGLSPRKTWYGGWAWSPVYISPRQQTMHQHVVGKTGSGKTASILWPSVLQDALDGKGILVMDAKGSNENVQVIKGIARLAKRAHQLRVFALPAWNRSSVPSGTYNMVYVRPRTPTDPGGDPVATAERVFSILQLGDNLYYNTQAEIMFTNLCKLLHGMTDEAGYGLPFVMLDLAVCFKGAGVEDGPWARALKFCLEHSADRVAAREIESHIQRLRNDVQKCFSGVIGALDKFLSPLVNAYAPDIRYDQVLEENLIVYAQLPANLFKLQAPAMGRVMLMDVQQEGSLRQVLRTTRNQTPFAVVVDEFYNFADPTIIDSLNKLRDANLEFTLAHQSIADLEMISKEFAVSVWDNTRTKHILNQDNPELCEKLAKSVGTEKVVEQTVRQQQGALFTSLRTGDASTKLVEGYKLHPNSIKGLARCGQGYLYNDEGIRRVAYGMLPLGIDAGGVLPQKKRPDVPGLRLYNRFIGSPAAIPSQGSS
jgi:TraM recognition site of TraD and TraG